MQLKFLRDFMTHDMTTDYERSFGQHFHSTYSSITFIFKILSHASIREVPIILSLDKNILSSQRDDASRAFQSVVKCDACQTHSAPPLSNAEATALRQFGVQSRSCSENRETKNLNPFIYRRQHNGMLEQASERMRCHQINALRPPL